MADVRRRHLGRGSRATLVSRGSAQSRRPSRKSSSRPRGASITCRTCLSPSSPSPAKISNERGITSMQDLSCRCAERRRCGRSWRATTRRSFVMRGIPNVGIVHRWNLAERGLPGQQRTPAERVHRASSAIEVLRGPQGTLYGRDSTGGAIRILHAAVPQTSLAFTVDLSLGNYDRRDFTGVRSIAVRRKLSYTLYRW